MIIQNEFCKLLSSESFIKLTRQTHHSSTLLDNTNTNVPLHYTNRTGLLGTTVMDYESIFTIMDLYKTPQKHIALYITMYQNTSLSFKPVENNFRFVLYQI